ncbi:MAG: phosphate transport system regulatory protein PhoU [Nitrospirae bacterium GWC2_56_14]|nr:MAG: phosphate transport system regulatory protein PhoU [Nitrospirae bacterium GWC2_56_14]
MEKREKLMARQKEQDLEALKERVLKMGGFVEESIRKSVTALVERDRNLAIEVIDGDAIVNNYDVEIEEECIRFLAIWQPSGSNLRFITTAIKIITDLERMGDLAVDICERTIELNDEPPLKPYIDIPRMAEAAQKMLKDSLDAFVARDANLALNVCAADDFVDNLNHQIFNELLVYMLQDPKNISRAVRLTYITKYLERIADHATNIAEMVVYMVQGKVIRHTACEARVGDSQKQD